MSKKDKNKKNKIRLGVVLLFLSGLIVLFYPLISRTYYDYRGNEEANHYQEGLVQISTTEAEEKLQLGHAYNQALLTADVTPLGDPFSEEEKVEGVAAYAESIEIREKIGVLTIPKINMKFPIFAGTHEDVLQQGVGHLEGTSLPIGGLNTNSILTAHRGLAENKLFTDLDQVNVGDLFFLETIAGQLAYKVIETKVIEPTEIEALKIEKNQDLVTLLTCTPFMVNTHRLLVIGERTEVPEEEKEEAMAIRWWEHLYSLIREYIWIILGLAALLLVLFIRSLWKAKGRD